MDTKLAQLRAFGKLIASPTKAYVTMTRDPSALPHLTLWPSRSRRRKPAKPSAFTVPALTPAGVTNPVMTTAAAATPAAAKPIKL